MRICAAILALGCLLGGTKGAQVDGDISVKEAEAFKPIFPKDPAPPVSEEVVPEPPIPSIPNIGEMGGTLEGRRPILLGFLRLEELFRLLTHIQRQFFTAIFPDNWAIPKFIPSHTPAVSQLQRWVSEASEKLGPDSLSSVLREISEGNSGVLQSLPKPPLLLEQIVKGVTNPMESFGSFSEEVLRSLPNVDLLNLDAIDNAFKLPSDVEWPVPLDSLNLLIPVLVTDAAESREETISGSTPIISAIGNIKVPIVTQEGQLVFAPISSIFRGIKLPNTLNITPLALFKNRVVNDIATLWEMLKAPMLSKMTALGESAPAMFAPVLSLASLPRVSLALSGEEGEPQTSQLGQLIAKMAEELRQNLQTFFDIFFKPLTPPSADSGGEGTVARSTQQFMDEPIEDFMNLRFLNFSLPVVGIAEQSAPMLFAPLNVLTKCSTSSDCPLSLPLPTFPEFLVSPDKSIERLYKTIEALSTELQNTVVQLQKKVLGAFPNSLILAPDGSGLSLTDTLLSLSGSLNAAVYFVKEKVMKLNHLLKQILKGLAPTQPPAVLPPTVVGPTEPPVEDSVGDSVGDGEVASSFKSILGSFPSGPILDVPRNVYSTVLKALPSVDQPALRAPKRRLEDYSSLIPAEASLEDLLSLKSVTDKLRSIELPSSVLGFPSPQSLGQLESLRAVSPQLLNQPLGRIFKDSPLLPEAWNNLNVGALMEVAKSLDTLFKNQMHPTVEAPHFANKQIQEFERGAGTLLNPSDFKNKIGTALKNGVQFF